MDFATNSVGRYPAEMPLPPPEPLYAQDRSYGGSTMDLSLPPANLPALPDHALDERRDESAHAQTYGYPTQGYEEGSSFAAGSPPVTQGGRLPPMSSYQDGRFMPPSGSYPYGYY